MFFKPLAGFLNGRNCRPVEDEGIDQVHAPDEIIDVIEAADGMAEPFRGAGGKMVYPAKPITRWVSIYLPSFFERQSLQWGHKQAKPLYPPTPTVRIDEHGAILQNSRFDMDVHRF